MFAARYFTPHYFAPRFFTASSSDDALSVPTVTVDLADHRTGDTFVGHTFTVLDEDDVPVSLTGATISIQFRSGKRLVGEMDLSDGLSVVSASGGTFRIDPQTVDYEPTVLDYDAQVTTSGGDVYTVASGRWCILQDVTN